MALLIGLGGCNPVETYRHWTGVAENDPNPATTPNTKNLAAGEAASYPNLATVPAPPTQALSTAELDKLTQSLIADRAQRQIHQRAAAGQIRRGRGSRRRHRRRPQRPRCVRTRGPRRYRAERRSVIRGAGQGNTSRVASRRREPRQPGHQARRRQMR